MNDWVTYDEITAERLCKFCDSIRGNILKTPLEWFGGISNVNVMNVLQLVNCKDEYNAMIHNGHLIIERKK